MRTYLILKERAERWGADAEIQAMVKDLGKASASVPPMTEYSTKAGDGLLEHTFDRAALASRGLGYERLDQLTMEVILGAR